MVLREGAFAMRMWFTAVGTVAASALDLLLASSLGAFAAAACVTFTARGGYIGGGGRRR